MNNAGHIIACCEEMVECLHLIFGTGNESRFPYYTPNQDGNGVINQPPLVSVAYCYEAECVFCVILVGKVKAHIYFLFMLD